MQPLMAKGVRTLCRIADIPENGAIGFPGFDGAFTGFVAVRQGEHAYVYENACPHIGTPLDWTPNRFLSADGRYLICATHGAEFTITDGMCISGPCRGDSLTPVNVEIRDGNILISYGG